MKYFLVCFLLFGCSNPPSPKTVELDLCSVRRAFKALEAADQSLLPSPGGMRERLEESEDALCAIVAP